MEARTFIQCFRSSAPYVHAHRGRTFVVSISGEAIASESLPNIVHDLALLHALGIKLVLVVGARPQIERALAARGHKARVVHGVRVTDEVALGCVKEAVGAVRVEMEALLSMGLPNSPMAGARIRVAAGNFVMARPLGVVGGVDYLHTGEVRRVDAEAIQQRLADDAIVLLSPIGYSATGEAFNLRLDDVAVSAAMALRADKLVSLLESRAVLDERRQPIHERTAEEIEALLARRKRMPDDVEKNLRAAVRACRGGVSRAHLVSRRSDGGLLLELFTRDGVGMLVTAEPFEGVRQAQLSDVVGILSLIEPLEEAGVLIRRSREHLETEIGDFTVIERDGTILGCAALHPFPEEQIAELACLVVHPEYRDTHRGETLLAYLERRAQELGITRLFALTTRTSHWFREHGFELGNVDDLPKRRRPRYDKRRGSKVLVKTLTRRHAKTKKR